MNENGGNTRTVKSLKISKRFVSPHAGQYLQRDSGPQQDHGESAEKAAGHHDLNRSDAGGKKPVCAILKSRAADK